jgi:[ribosomal protein S18]-alanine N-acetyltransferase
MSTDLIIEPAGIKDLDAVMKVMADSFDPAYGEAWTAAQCAGLIPMSGVWLSLARIGDTPVGFALSRIVLREAELLLLAVSRDWQRRGIGERLLDNFIRTATVRGADRLHLEVRDGNYAASLYSKAGFSQVGRRRNYYNGRDGQVYDALTLSKTAND